MRVSQLKPDDLTQDTIDRILYESVMDDGLSGDCILVFGSRLAAENRVPKAVELFLAGRSDKILFSGGKEIKFKGKKVTEAKAMFDTALTLGVPKEYLIREEISQNSAKENILGSLLQLDRTMGLHRVRRILLVTTRYHMRRCMLMAKTYMPSWIQCSMCPADDADTRRDTWYLTVQGTNRARNEVLKIIACIREGSILDFDL